MYNYDFYVVELFVWMVLCISQRTIAFTKISSDFYTIIRKSLHPTRPLTEQHYKKEVQQKWHQFLPWCMVIYLSLVSFHRNRASVTEQKMAHMKHSRDIVCFSVRHEDVHLLTSSAVAQTNVFLHTNVCFKFERAGKFLQMTVKTICCFCRQTGNCAFTSTN